MSFQPNLKQREKYNHEMYNENSQLIKTVTKLKPLFVFYITRCKKFGINLCFDYNKNGVIKGCYLL